MEALRDLRKEIKTDFLSTVTCNTFRKQYYFDKVETVINAVGVHKKYAEDPREYVQLVDRYLDVMLDSHKILACLYIFDSKLPATQRNNKILKILLKTRPDMVPDFWLSFRDFAGELGIKRKSLGQQGRKLVWRYVLAKEEQQGRRRIIMQLLKDKKKWNEVFYYAHAHMEGELEKIIGHVLFDREIDLDGKWEEEGSEDTIGFLKDLASITDASKKKALSLDMIKYSNLPFRTIEGYAASSGISTDSAEFYNVAYDKMTAYETLRRGDAMMRRGFPMEKWMDRVTKMVRVYDPVDIGSILLQHPEMEMMEELLSDSINHHLLQFQEGDIVLVDASRSMKGVLRNMRPRCIWELVGVMASRQGVTTYLLRDTPTKVEAEMKFGSEESYNPTNLSAGIEVAMGAKRIILITDGQDNIPYRGACKGVAEKFKGRILTFNPTINPNDPGVATGIGSSNEILLPGRDISTIKKLLEVV